MAAARLIAERLGSGGRLVVQGSDRAAADARHVVVEYLHPVIVGKPALPAVLATTAVTSGNTQGPMSGDGQPHGHAGPKTTDGAKDVIIGIAYDGSRLDGAVDVAISDHPVPGADVQIDLPSNPNRAKHAAVVSYHILWEMTHTFLQQRAGSGGTGSSLEALYPMLYESGSTASPDNQALSSVAEKLAEAAEVRGRTLTENNLAIDRAAEILAAASSIFTFGNGGSATDAADLAYALGSKGVALSSDMATVTALANDVSFDVVFARPLATLARSDDAVVGLSTSGGSTNVLAGLRYAKSSGIPCIGLAGYWGGEMTAVEPDVMLTVDSTSVHRIQEAQVALYSEVVERAALTP